MENVNTVHVYQEKWKNGRKHKRLIDIIIQ